LSTQEFFSEVVEAVRSVGAEVYIPEYSKEKVRMVEDVFGFKPASGDLRALLAQALSLAEYNMGVKGAIVMTCFRCGEGSLVRHVVRSFIVERLRVPGDSILVY
jgi:activator of 2-hydroxyglutaryl-CoA dehydratase